MQRFQRAFSTVSSALMIQIKTRPLQLSHSDALEQGLQMTKSNVKSVGV